MKPLRPTYPPTALSSGIEGWVDLTFTVTREGKVAMSRSSIRPKKTFDGGEPRRRIPRALQAVVKDGHAISVRRGFASCSRSANRARAEMTPVADNAVFSETTTLGRRHRATQLCLVVHDDLELRLKLASLVRRSAVKLDADTITSAGSMRSRSSACAPMPPCC
jgi:hypothetical protein